MRRQIVVETTEGGVVVVVVNEDRHAMRPEDTTPGWSDMPDDPFDDRPSNGDDESPV